MAAPDTHCQPEHALRRHGRHQNSGRGIVVFEVSLHDEAAQGMSDEHRLAAEAVGRGMNVVDVVGDRARVETLRGGAAAVPAQTQCNRAIAGVGKEVQEVAPARRGMPTAVDEQQRHRMGFAARSFVDHLEHASILSHLC